MIFSKIAKRRPVVAERSLNGSGSCRILINGEKQLTVQCGTSLLSALRGQKIFLPSACGGRGLCAYCKCKVFRGGGDLLPAETSLLSSEEIDKGFRLACQVKVTNDLEIKIPEKLFRIGVFRAKVDRIDDLTYDIKLVRLRLEDGEEIHFTPGQYVQLQSKPYEGVKTSVSRAYSIASPSSETKSVDLMIRLVPDGICTTWVHKYLQTGESVTFTGPMGDFRLHEGEGEIVMVAGGSGMAPMVSLLSELIRSKSGRKVTYFFGAVTKRDLFYMNEIDIFMKEIPNFKFVPALSQPAPEDAWEGVTGLITVPLENYLKTIEPSQAQGYMCGSPGMIKACMGVFNKNGVSSDRIFFDPFA